ncbi:hypothetical protein [Nonomuraea rhizosphaerae]|uniref:hypothetical protein n=1 Tax=Nonomuraea rhizosphaerae TaxID=2665663 RepID=UPI001C5CF4CD|nr:hypothetical protein [Nonomuraea rhizosphaerae]
MGDTPAIAFGLLCLALGILFYRKRAKLTRGAVSAPSTSADGKTTTARTAGAGAGRGRRIGIPAAVLYRIISGLMFLGGVGLASTFIGDWLDSLDFSIGQVSAPAIVTIVAVLLGFAVGIDVFDGNGLKPSTYGMIVLFPLLWATAGGSLAWPKALSAWAWSQMTGAI